MTGALGLPQERNKCEQELKLFKNSRVGGPGWGSIIENILKKKNRIVYGLGVDTVKLKKNWGGEGSWSSRLGVNQQLTLL